MPLVSWTRLSPPAWIDGRMSSAMIAVRGIASTRTASSFSSCRRLSLDGRLAMPTPPRSAVSSLKKRAAFERRSRKVIVAQVELYRLAPVISRAPACRGVTPFGKLFNHFLVERRNIVGLARRDHPVVHHTFFVYPLCPGCCGDRWPATAMTSFGAPWSRRLR